MEEIFDVRCKVVTLVDLLLMQLGLLNSQVGGLLLGAEDLAPPGDAFPLGLRLLPVEVLDK